ncbi:WD40 repeat domain-containing protein [Candidatus Babela massiliensis]|uniref:WD40 repeat containing protein n=1 Tax=Candidatus Babela massiliensis TaxID=673862 RepID=V6DFF0_9BACT|nr:hypothetical protein [Candidatus Babela massiliensis]CDK30322.1 WD40 repeat containing protein [Candidatus Babela massiliensis]
MNKIKKIFFYQVLLLINSIFSMSQEARVEKNKVNYNLTELCIERCCQLLVEKKLSIQDLKKIPEDLKDPIKDYFIINYPEIAWSFEDNISTSQDAHQEGIITYAISPDNKIVVTGAFDNTVKIWDIETGKCLKTLKHNSMITDIAISNNIIISTTNNCLYLWSTKGAFIKSIKTNQNTYFILLDANNMIITIGNDNKKINILEIDSPHQLSKETDHQKLIKSLKLTSDNKYLITHSFDNTTKIWSYPNISCLRTISNSYSTTLSNNNQILIIGHDQDVVLYNISDNNIMQTLSGHNNKVTSVAISSNNKFLVSSDKDNITKIWNLKSEICLFSIVQNNEVKHLMITPDEKFLITSTGNLLKIWDINTGKLIKEHQSKYHINLLKISSNNKFIITSSLGETKIKIIYIPSSKTLSEILSKIS